MTTPRGPNATVRARPGTDRLLPLGRAEDGAWLAERAARAVLCAAARTVDGVDPGPLRIALADPDTAGSPVFPPPPAALPPGPLRVAAEFAAYGDRPLRELAEGLRAALSTASWHGLGLVVEEIDLRVTALLDVAPAPGGTPSGPPGVAPQDDLGATVAAVPGVARLTGTLGVPVRVGRTGTRVELATAAGHHPLVVARAVRGAITPLLPAPAPVTVLITGVADPGIPARHAPGT
ncbi:hypothetical protein ACFXOS_08845 [Streptomyces sp. NPDC059175]|uniref:hypothetical protein n=1 Tax=Streptomyces sp. NPDC059175 TaxID=3346757 RepID=UPI0036776CA3